MMGGASTTLERASGVKTPVLNWGVGSFESLEREGVALPRCAAWASRKSFVLATAKSSRREVAASSLQPVFSNCILCSISYRLIRVVKFIPDAENIPLMTKSMETRLGTLNKLRFELHVAKVEEWVKI